MMKILIEIFTMIHVRVSEEIEAERDVLYSAYLDYPSWNRLFPSTIRDTQLIKAEPGRLEVSVDHRTAGKVTNIIIPVSDERIALEEFKPKYSARFTIGSICH